MNEAVRGVKQSHRLLFHWYAITLFLTFSLTMVESSTLHAAAKVGRSTPPAANNEEYGKKIKEYTTESRFNTEFTDHLPASSTVTAPDKFLGYVIGTPKKLTHVDRINAYMRELERTAPKRVKVLSIGKSEEGREMIAVVVTSEDNMARLDELRGITAKLADPRKISDDDAKKLIALNKTHSGAQKRGFAATVRTDQDRRRACRNRQSDTIEDRHITGHDLGVYKHQRKVGVGCAHAHPA